MELMRMILECLWISADRNGSIFSVYVVHIVVACEHIMACKAFIFYRLLKK